MMFCRVATVRSSTFLKHCRASPLSLNCGLTSPNRNLWNCFGRQKTCYGGLAIRILRAFERNLKSIRNLGKCTKESVFGTLLENRLLQVMLVDFGRKFTKNRDMLLSATCLSVYNWEENAVREEKFMDFANDVEFIGHLMLETLTCKSCQQRLQVDQKVPGVIYCTCSDSKPPCLDLNGWKPFIERSNTLVWRKEHEVYKGLYAYKMYVRFEKVAAMDFLRVQLDTNFRKKWDSSATELKVIDENKNISSDLVYWEMRWPKPFASRDYVFERKLTFIPKENVCIVSSVATSHPSIPSNKSIHRVTEYWSFMVVKPFTDFEKPGLEFVLTYFDNPGLSIPSSVSTWVAMTGLPSFVNKLSDATSKVSELVGPEPTLLQCFRAQLHMHRGNVITTTEKEESFTVPTGDDSTEVEQQGTVTIDDFSVTIVEGPSSTPEDEQTQSCIPSGESSEPESGPSSPYVNADPVSPISSALPGSSTSSNSSNNNNNSKGTPPFPNNSTTSGSCGDNSQFLARNPVYA